MSAMVRTPISSVLFGPLALVSPVRASHVLERNVRDYRRRWVVVVSGFFEPFFYLLSIGVGLNHLIGTVSVNGRPVSYTVYVAPGLLASAAMNGAIFDSTYNLFFKLKVTKTYNAVLASPIGVGDVSVGELSWSVARGAMYSSGFLVVMAAFGLVRSPYAVLCLPAAALVSLAFGAVGAAATTFMSSWQSLSSVALAMLPLFLFSGTFFQLSVYPAWFSWVIRLSPLYQGVDMLRDFNLGTLSPMIFVHIGYLLAMAATGLLVSSRRLQALLAP